MYYYKQLKSDPLINRLQSHKSSYILWICPQVVPRILITGFWVESETKISFNTTTIFIYSLSNENTLCVGYYDDYDYGMAVRACLCFYNPYTDKKTSKSFFWWNLIKCFHQIHFHFVIILHFYCRKEKKYSKL